jgi:hypothetical protein
MSKLSDYLNKNKIDARRVVAASADIECNRPEDRAIAMARIQSKEGGTDAQKELAAKKRRGGRKLSRPELDRALGGQSLSRRGRARVIRAVNAVLKHKSKGGEAKAADLF